MADRFVTYIRVSTRKQGQSGLGLEAQQRDIALYLQTVEGAEVVGEFQEVESGKEDTNRPELQRAIGVAREKGAVLLVSKVDRLSRDAHYVLGLMKDKKLTFRVASMPNADNFMLGIHALLGQQERDFISARTKAALAEAKKRGVVLGGLRPRTEASNQARKQEALRHANQLALVADLRDAGHSFFKIAARLNGSGVPTASGRGQWHAKTVQRVCERLENQACSAAESMLAA